MNNIRVLLTLVFAFVGNAAAYGVAIDFEGFGPTNAPLTEGTPLALATAQGVTVQFETIDTAGVSYTPFIAEAGGDRVAFQSVNYEDTPVYGDGSIYLLGGNYSLTDGLLRTHDYKLTFSHPVEDLSLDVYDFRGDGPHAFANLGSDVLTLRTFDASGNPLGVATHTLSMSRPVDGNVITMAVNDTGIYSALLDFASIEGGTAIDNIDFTPAVVPEPASMSLFLLGLLFVMKNRSHPFSLRK